MGSLKRLFNNKMTILRLRKVEDNMGGYTTQWEKLYWDLDCRIYGLGSSSSSLGYRVTFEGKEYFITDKLICEKNIDIKSGDRLQEANTNDIFLVIRIKKVYRLKRLDHIECYLAKIEAEIL